MKVPSLLICPIRSSADSFLQRRAQSVERFAPSLHALRLSPVDSLLRYCFSYGIPSSAGGVAWPTTPASTTMVTM